MGKAQRIWANKKHKELIRLLGGKCAECGSEAFLEIDHPDFKDYRANEIAYDTRVRRYWREYHSGVRLRVLCADCNKKFQPKRIDHRLDLEVEPVF